MPKTSFAKSPPILSTPSKYSKYKGLVYSPSYVPHKLTYYSTYINSKLNSAHCWTDIIGAGITGLFYTRYVLSSNGWMDSIRARIVHVFWHPILQILIDMAVSFRISGQHDNKLLPCTDFLNQADFFIFRNWR